MGIFAIILSAAALFFMVGAGRESPLSVVRGLSFGKLNVFFVAWLVTCAIIFPVYLIVYFFTYWVQS